MEKEIQYELCDDGGSNAIWMPILLPVGTQFQHEFGAYKVEQIFEKPEGGVIVICERLSKETHNFFQNKKTI